MMKQSTPSWVVLLRTCESKKPQPLELRFRALLSEGITYGVEVAGGLTR